LAAGGHDRHRDQKELRNLGLHVAEAQFLLPLRHQ
jgi:hypothetical protein